MLIGIDPGLSGAVAVLDTDGVLLALHDVPILTLWLEKSRLCEG